MRVRIRRTGEVHAWVFTAPALLLLATVIALPLLSVLPTGIAELGRLRHDPYIARIAWNTLAFAGVTVVCEVALGVAFAMILHHTLRLRGFVRAAALLPWALPTAVMAMAWRWIFNDSFGVANDLPMRLGLLKEPVAWLARPGTAFISVVIADVWKTTPFVTLLVLAGLQSIPRDLYEALEIDGAGTVRRFSLITLPLLRPVLALAVIFRIIQAMGIFDLVWVMTGGGPANSTKTIALYIYDQYFRFQEWGYGAALTIVAGISMFAIAAAAGALVRGRRIP